MQRFAIKIDKSVKARLKNLCRLCGMENSNQIEILNAAEWIDLTIEGEVTLSRKIADCVGIEVMKNDRMPQRICAMCVDKISDFYEFREMCQATNIQTRKLLNIPEPKAPKKVAIKSEEPDVESIFGIVGADTKDTKSKAEPPPKPLKKSKKMPAPSTTTSATNENRFRGMTKREIEITLELERIKKEEDEEKQAKLTDTRTKNGKRKKVTAKAPTDGMLLAPKEPNQRERKREIEQKRIEKKRKPDTKIKPPPKKKIKKEPCILCNICDARFDKATLRDAHLVVHHRPITSAYGCSSCIESILTKAESDAHFEWHSMFNVPFKCLLCEATFEKSVTFQRHISACTHPSFSLLNSFTDNIYCKRCKQEYETQNLYDWHSCFMSDNSACPNCDRVFIKRSVLMKHFFKCDGPLSKDEPLKKSTAKSKKSKPSSSGKSKDVPTQNSFKHEPETIIEPADEAYDGIDDSYMDTHFGDSDNEFEASDSIMTTAEMPVQTSVGSSVAVALENNAASSSSTAKKSTTCLSSKPSIRTNLSQPLLECCVKLEPIDLSSFTASGSINVAQIEKRISTVPPLVISRPTVSPLTIRIKKEVIQPGYGDVFDPNLARNIKQEQGDETWELASTSKCSKSSEHSSPSKKTKHRNKAKKLYKKPALLAIKIKQERMEREETDSDYYRDYSIPTDHFNEHLVNQTFDNNPLPIITQIHSVLEPPSSIPMAIEQASATNTSINTIPFVPIRIKSEFQKPVTPPPPDQPENEDLGNERTEVTSNSPPVDELQIQNRANEYDEIGSNPTPANQPENEDPVNEHAEVTSRLPPVDELQIQNPSIEYDEMESNPPPVDQPENDGPVNGNQDPVNEHAEVTSSLPPVDELQIQNPANKYDEIGSNPPTADQQQKEIPANENTDQVEHETMAQCENASKLQDNECSTKLKPNEINGSNLQLSPTIDQSLDAFKETSLSHSIVESSDRSDEVTPNPETIPPSINDASSEHCLKTIAEIDSNVGSTTPLNQDEVLPQDKIQSHNEIELSSNEIGPSQVEISPDENQTTADNEQDDVQLEKLPIQENERNGTEDDALVEMHLNVETSIDIDINAVPNIQHSIDQIEMKNLPSDNQLIDESEQNMANPSLSDVNNQRVSDVLDAVANENMSPIEFHDTIPNDDSLNFIDQLVHEVADTMASHIDTVQTELNTIQFNATDYAAENNVECADETVATVAETSPQLVAELDKNSADDDLLALSDISEIDYDDLLPALNTSEHKPNGSEVDANPSIETDQDAHNEIAKLMNEHSTSDGSKPNLPLK